MVEFDVIVIGGGISGSVFTLRLLKQQPDIRVLVIEGSEKFYPKAGESFSDLSSLFFERMHIPHVLAWHRRKAGLRFLFKSQNEKQETVYNELNSPTIKGRLKGYHLQRDLFDEDLLHECKTAGATVWRPAKILDVAVGNLSNHLKVEHNGETITIHATFLVDASGRSRFLSKQLGWADEKIPLKTNALMAYFYHADFTQGWDMSNHKEWERLAELEISFSTTHLLRKHSWWWVIRLNDELTSVGVVFDHHVPFPSDPEIQFENWISEDPQLSRLLANAHHEGVKCLHNLPYLSNRLYAPGVALLADSGFFIDPMFSPGIELMCQQSEGLARLVSGYFKKKKYNASAWARHERLFMNAIKDRMRFYVFGYRFMHQFRLFSSWVMLANMVYFGLSVFPSVAVKGRLRVPKTLTWIESRILEILGGRYVKLASQKEYNGIFHENQNRQVFSGVRVPFGIAFFVVPVELALRWLSSYLKLEATAMKHKRQPVNKPVTT